ncbi:sensor histidine kinase [Glutamicibacter uratoxydans]|uniref:sensor histidine kinase n=1 Tax=Glutamicibacter uratoxydans TaxID=43667 RepID=UPI003D6FB190
MDQSGSWRVTGILWAVVIFLAMILLSLLAEPHAWSDPQWLTHLLLTGGFALGFAALSLARRSVPRITLVLAALGAGGYYAAGLPSLALAPALMVILFAVVMAGHQIFAGAVAVGIYLVSSVLRILAGEEPDTVLGYELVASLGLAAVAMVLAQAVLYLRRAEAAERKLVTSTQKLDDLKSKARIKFDADRQWMQERSRLYLNAQDELAHHLAVATLHGNAALEQAKSGQPAIVSLEYIRESTRKALMILRRSVDSLSDTDASSRTAGSLGNIVELVSSLRDAGIRVDMNAPGVDLDDRLPILLMRLLREAATNAVIHADTTHLVIFLRPQPPQQNRNLWHVSVRNDGVRARGNQFTGGDSLSNLRRKILESGGSMEWGQLGNNFLISAEIFQKREQ